MHSSPHIPIPPPSTISIFLTFNFEITLWVVEGRIDEGNRTCGISEFPVDGRNENDRFAAEFPRFPIAILCKFRLGQTGSQWYNKTNHSKVESSEEKPLKKRYPYYCFIKISKCMHQKLAHSRNDAADLTSRGQCTPEKPALPIVTCRCVEF